jgi:nucleoside diphosphate kinase
MFELEKTLALVKPDAFQAGHESSIRQVRSVPGCGETKQDGCSRHAVIVRAFEIRGRWLATARRRTPPKRACSEHASDTEYAIVQIIELEGLTILEKRSVVLTEEFVRQFYAEHKGKAFYQNLKSFMTSGPTCAMMLGGNQAVARWREMMGPTDTGKAKAEAPTSLRALFGTGMPHHHPTTALPPIHKACDS